MSIDIAKQLDLRPYSDKNAVSKTVVETQSAAAQPVDEEKSNAAKWMIGLTATAAIAIGGLYLAKHGKLGESAEKWAKKLFGEAANEVTPKPTTSTTPTAPVTPATSGTSDPIPAVAALAPLTFAHKGIRKLIKQPNKSLTEIMSEFTQAGVKIEKKGENLLEIRTGNHPDDITELHFTPEGILSSIQRTTKKAVRETFSFENKVLSTIEREVPKEYGKPLIHQIQFAQDGTVKAKRFILTHGPELQRVNSSSLEAFKTAEIVEAYLPRTSNFFNQAVNDLEMARNAANRTLERYSVTVDDVLSPIRKASRNGEKLTRIPSENIEKALKLSIEDKKLAAPIARLIEQDMGSSKHISLHTLELLGKKYSEALKAYGIDKPEQLEAIAKPLNKCSKADLIKIIGNRDSVHKIFPGCFDDYGMLDVEFLSSKPGFSHVKEHMTIFDILKDIV